MASKCIWFCVLVASIVLSLSVAVRGNTEPVTLYKARDIAVARENVKRYPWAQKIVNSWKRDTEYALNVDTVFFERMLSTTTPWPDEGLNCPACVGRLSAMGEHGLWRWSVQDPDHLTCKYCGTVYPNTQYPETGLMTAKRMGQTFTFYLTDEERQHPEDKSGKYAFHWASWPVHTSWSGFIRYRKAAWCIDQVLPLAKLYAITGEVRYAERAALILDDVAKVYPNWLYHSYNGTYADCPGSEAAAEIGKNLPAGKFPIDTIITAFPGLHTRDGYAVLNNGFWGAGRFLTFGTDAEMILDMAIAYDLIHEAKRSDGSTALSPEIEKRIVNDLILSGCTDTEYSNAINNQCGPSRALSGVVGIIFQRPESVRRCLEGFEALMSKSFYFDGFCAESPSYSDMHLGNLQFLPEILLGYSDPKGYQPTDGKIIQNLDPFRSMGRYRLALESMVRMLDCNRKYPIIGDTHIGQGIQFIHAEVLTDRYDPSYAGLLVESQGAQLADKGSEYALWHRDPDLKADRKTSLPLHTEWFPGWQVGVLRGFEKSTGTNLYFNGYSQGPHRHYDTLGIAYTEFGKELMFDQGYIYDDPRNAWSRSTLAHNVVTVDGENQIGEGRQSKLELFAVSPSVQVVQASSNAYRQCDEYRRTTALVQLPGGGTYLVDFFRVQGGKKHQYSFHCNGQCTGITGADPQPVSENITWLANIRAASPRTPVTVAWQHEGVNVEVKLLNPIDRFLVVDAPGWRTSKGSDLNAKPITECITERVDAERAVSRFVTVTVPFTGLKSPVKSARLLPTSDSNDGGMAVEVKFADGRTDYVVSSRDGVRQNYGPVSMAGSFGYVSLDASGRVGNAFLADGIALQGRNLTLSLPQPKNEYRVASVEGRTFHLEKPIPGGSVKKGMYILAAGTGYEIESVNGNVITVRDYPAVECDSVSVINTAWKK